MLRWVLYEKPNFKGEKIALDEGDIETLSNPFDTTDEAHEQNGQRQDGEGNQEPKTKKFVIGSIRRAVRVRTSTLPKLHYKNTTLFLHGFIERVCIGFSLTDYTATKLLICVNIQ